MSNDRQATAIKKVAPLEEIKTALVKLEPQFKAALPAQISPERFIRIAQTAVSTNPDLVRANRQSLFASLMKCAQDGLLPDGREAALVIYNTKAAGPVAQYMPMVGGIMKKVRNSGEISSWSLQVVKEHDEFEIQMGDQEQIYHRPALSSRGKTIGAYSIVTFKNGDKSREYMSVDEIESIRARSRAKDRGPWATDYDEMCKKTVARRHSKKLPMSTDLQNLWHQDDEQFEFRDDKSVNEEKARPTRLAQIIDAQAEKPVERQPAEEIASVDEEVVEGQIPDDELPDFS